MGSLASPSIHRGASLLTKPSFKRGHVRFRAGGQSIMSVSVQQHFGTKAIEEFEKSELGQLDVDLAKLSEQLKERGK